MKCEIDWLVFCVVTLCSPWFCFAISDTYEKVYSVIERKYSGGEGTGTAL